MPIAESQRLRIPSHYYVYSEPPDKTGEEVLHFVSPHRRVKLRGRSFREFVQHVQPLLDGRHSFEEIHAEVSDLFEPEDLAACFDVLSENGLLEDAAQSTLAPEVEERLRPQLNLFHDLAPEGARLQERLAAARVSVFGLTGAGAVAASSLAAAGIGTVRCIDDGPVTAADTYFSAAFELTDTGSARCDAMCRRVRRSAPQVRYEAVPDRLPDDDAVERAIAGSHFVVNCVDEGNISLVYKLNRVCLKLRIPWISAAASGLEVIVGPAVYPGETACYMCYRMRLVACADKPEAEFDFQSYLDRRKRDDSSRHANLVFGVGIAGQLAALEAVKALSGAGQPATRGKLQIIDLRDLSSSRHVVLRKPWCPACFADWDSGGQE
ncbi:MAG TPA: TOMM precursor leader peptide-binding protein [Bryobacteraceae bacterium]|nr:TOMM precursor leader peptide-binding protein [Bryobacteraceae bacterium]